MRSLPKLLQISSDLLFIATFIFMSQSWNSKGPPESGKFHSYVSVLCFIAGLLCWITGYFYETRLKKPPTQPQTQDQEPDA